MQAIKEAVRSTFSPKIYVKERVFAVHTRMDPLVQKKFQVIYSAWLVICDKNHEEDKNLSSEVRSGFHSMSFEDAVKEKLFEAENEARKNGVAPKYSEMLPELERAVDEVTHAALEEKTVPYSYLFETLETLNANINQETGFFGQAPSMIDAAVYLAIKKMIASENTIVQETISDCVDLQNFSFRIDAMCFEAMQ